MFETVSPETFRPRSRRLFYETLPVSLALHGAAILGIILYTTWNVAFPEESPRMLAMYRLEDLPTPPPPPPPPAAAPQRVVQAPVIRMPENVAPNIIPDVVIPATPQPVVAEVAEEGLVEGVDGGIAGGFIGGSPFGVEGGEIGGVEGGTLGAIVTEAAPPDTVMVKRDAPLPTAPMSMVFPKYPESARVRGWEDKVIVRYTIGKNGRVREVLVLNKPERELFEEITVKAIRNWRFKPHKVDGVPQEIVHELTVFFKLNA
jgi:protein TonB